MIDTINLSEQRYKRRIDVNSPFVLIGNNIDGYVDIEVEDFTNFEDLKLRLPKILLEFKAVGEWSIKLFQYKNKYRIIEKYDYYRVPSNGRLIFEHDYMNWPIKNVIIDDKMIQTIGMDVELLEASNPRIFDSKNIYEVAIEVVKIDIR